MENPLTVTVTILHIAGPDLGITLKSGATQQWDATEFAELDLGDQRLNARVVQTAAHLTAQPQAPINRACADRATTKASYRLFHNDQVPAAAILAPHQHRTVARMAGHPLGLALQDTSYLNYTAHPATTGLGPIGTTAQDIRGWLMHTTLALTFRGGQV